MSKIKPVKKGQYTYYEFWDGGKFVKHIGNAEKLDKWQKEQEKAS